MIKKCTRCGKKGVYYDRWFAMSVHNIRCTCMVVSGFTKKGVIELWNKTCKLQRIFQAK